MFIYVVLCCTMLCVHSTLTTDLQLKYIDQHDITLTATQTPCPSECICLSQSQVMCNSVLLRDVPAGLPNIVTHLSLSRADIKVLRSDAFIGLRMLKKLTLDSINLTTIRPFAFRNLPKLKEIFIHHTPLTTVNAFSFAGLQNVTSIILTHNKIAQIEGYAFAGTNYLRLLSIKNNPLKIIMKNAFSGVSEINKIDLPSGIKHIEPEAFTGLEGLGTIELAYMDLDAIVPDMFKGIIRAKCISLRESDLGVIKVGAFDGMTHVDTIEIVNNKIDAVEELAFSYNATVKTFRLIGNHMLESPAAVNLEAETIIIKGNHLPCVCGEDPFANPLALTDDFARENFCISPLRSRGKTLESGLLACSSEAGGSARATARAGAEIIRVIDAIILTTLVFIKFIS